MVVLEWWRSPPEASWCWMGEGSLAVLCGDGQGHWAVVPLEEKGRDCWEPSLRWCSRQTESSGVQARLGWAAWGAGIYSPQEEWLPRHSINQFWGLSQLSWASTPFVFFAELLLARVVFLPHTLLQWKQDHYKTHGICIFKFTETFLTCPKAGFHWSHIFSFF